MGTTPSNYYVYNKCVRVEDLIDEDLKNKEKINYISPKERGSKTPLMVAIVNKLERNALKLLRSGLCDINIKDTFGIDALMYALACKLENVALEIITMMEEKANNNIKLYSKDSVDFQSSDSDSNNNSNDNRHELRRRNKSHDKEENMYLMNNHLDTNANVNVNVKEEEPKQKYENILRRLLSTQSGAKKTYLMYACEYGVITIMRKLIKMNNSNIDAVDDYNKTALMYACEQGHGTIITELINTGKSNPGQIDKNGNTALIHLCLVCTKRTQENNDNRLEEIIVELIRTKKANVFEANENGLNAIICACAGKLTTVISELMEYEFVNYNAVTNDGITCFGMLCFNNLEDTVLMMLKKPEITNLTIEKVCNKGYTAVTYMIKHKMVRALKVILTSNILISNINENCFIELLREHEDEFKCKITNYNAIEILVKNNAEDLLSEKMLKKYHQQSR
jgi:ankyrin repeat protein